MSPDLDDSILLAVRTLTWADVSAISIAVLGDCDKRSVGIVSRRLQVLRKLGLIHFFCGEWRTSK